MKLKGNKALNSQSFTKSGLKESIHWIPIDKLDQYNAYPSFMKEYLQTDYIGVRHIMTDERD